MLLFLILLNSYTLAANPAALTKQLLELYHQKKFMEAFDIFKTTFSKTYPTKAEELKRMSNFIVCSIFTQCYLINENRRH